MRKPNKFFRNIDWAASISFVIVFASVVAFSLVPGEEPISGKPGSQPVNLSNHPLYSTYQFDRSSGVINFGTQPLYLPTGLIAEAMARDVILREALSKRGTEIRFFPFLKGHDVNHFLTTEELAGGVGGDMPAFMAASQFDITILAEIQRGYTAIVANRPMITNELRGKSIGYALNSNAHFTLLQTLALENLTGRDVQLVPLEFNEMPRALADGIVDAFSAWEPIITITLMKYPSSRVIHRNLSTGYIYFLRSFSEQNPEITRQIIASELRAIHWMKSHSGNLLQAAEWAIMAGNELSGDSLELSPQQVARLAEKDIIGLLSQSVIPLNNPISDRRLQNEFDLMQSIGKIPQHIEYQRIRSSFDPLLVKDLLNNRVKYRLDEFDYREAASDSN